MAMNKVLSPTVFVLRHLATRSCPLLLPRQRKGKTERMSEKDTVSDETALIQSHSSQKFYSPATSLYTCVSSALGAGIKYQGTNGPAATPLERP